MSTRRWTTAADVTTKAHKLWDTGSPLTQAVESEPFTPFRVTISGPTPSERLSRFTETRAWVDNWRKAPPTIRVQWKTVKDRNVGTAQLPVAAHVDTINDLLALTGKTRDYVKFQQLVAATPNHFHPYLQRKPLRALEIAADWDAIVAAAEWLAANPDSGLYSRQIPAAGVHTKIVETYRRDIADLLPNEQPNLTAGRGWFQRKYGLAEKPLRARMRTLDPTMPGAPTYSDVEAPVEQIAAHPITAHQILIVENETTLLTLPDMPGTVALFGNGNAAPAIIRRIPWMATHPIWYWGDIDTYGLTILNDVRAAIGNQTTVHSLLMDANTLHSNRTAWTVEDKQATGPLPHLTPGEATVYRELINSRHGRGVRLEQERIPWTTVVAALTDMSETGNTIGVSIG